MLEAVKYRWKLRKLNKECSNVQSTYSELKKKASAKDLEQLHAEEGSEVIPLLEKIDLLKTRRLCQIANRHMVPLPDHDNKEFWRSETMGYRLYLTDKGFWETKKLIRQEKRERREGFVVWISVFTGFIGALTGLAAVLTR